MKHIVNIAFDFDDDRVRKYMDETIEETVRKDIRQAVVDNVFEKSAWGRNSHADPEKDPLQFWVKNMVRDALLECKDEICKLAAAELAQSMKRSKKCRDAVMSEVEP